MVVKSVKETIVGLFLLIDSIIYHFIGFVYQIFMFIADTEIMSADMINEFRNRMYLIIGVVMLFVVTYTLLKSIANPDDFIKGDNSAGKLIMKIVTSLVLIAVIPTVFSFARTFQAVAMRENIVGKIILGENESTVDSEELRIRGTSMAVDILQTFLHHPKGSEYDDEVESKAGANQGNLAESFAEIRRSNNFDLITHYAVNYVDGELTYNFIISTIAGAYVLFVIVSFCFDVGIRTVKLAFYEIMAPIPILSRIMPKNDIFNKWVKKTTSAYLELFIRLLVIFLGVYLISAVGSIFSSVNNSTSLTGAKEIISYEVAVNEKIESKYNSDINRLSNNVLAHNYDNDVIESTEIKTNYTSNVLLINNDTSNVDSNYNKSLAGTSTNSISPGVAQLAKLLIIMGIIAFMRQAPKLISDLFGLDSDGIKLGIMEKLAAGGGLMAAGMVGGGLTSAVQGAVNGKGWGRVSGLFGGLGAGAFRGIKNNWSSKNMADLSKNTASAIKTTTDNAKHRASRRASGQSVLTDIGRGFLGLATGDKQYYTNNPISQYDYFTDNLAKHDDITGSFGKQYKNRLDRLKHYKSLAPTEIVDMAGNTAADMIAAINAELSGPGVHTYTHSDGSVRNVTGMNLADKYTDAQGSAFRMQKFLTQLSANNAEAKKAGYDITKINAALADLRINSDGKMTDRTGRVYDNSAASLAMIDNLINNTDIYTSDTTHRNFKAGENNILNGDRASKVDKTALENSANYNIQKEIKERQQKSTSANQESKK